MAFSFQEPDQPTADRLSRAFPAFTDGFVRCQPGDLLMPLTFQKEWSQYQHFRVRQDDTWVVSFPKCGTTWTQEMVWLIANDCDFVGAKQLLRIRFPFLEERSLMPESSWEMFEGAHSTEHNVQVDDVLVPVNNIETHPSPRFIKSHLPLSYLPKDLLDTCKVVYVVRNPKDAAVSWYYHHFLDPIMMTTLSMEEFVEHFLNNEVLYTPYWYNVLEAWKRRHHPNFLFLFYEDLKKDLRGQLKKVASFLGKNLTEEQENALIHHLSFEQFKQNPAVNAEELQALGLFNKTGSFIRKGQVGDWKNHFSSELNTRFNQWMELHMKDSNFHFPEYP